MIISAAAVRFYFADANSYWLDELYSVVVYGIDHPSVGSAIRGLTRSIHPPLYQFILYNWMTIFGDSEVATRSLSNLYVAGATLCLYLAVRRIYGAWLGVITALVFSVMFSPTYFGLESRSYAQTIMLSSLSTLLMTHALPRLVTRSWPDLLKDGWVFAFIAVNAALLMTHYYNVLFLAAQGLFLVIYLLYRSARPFDAITKAIAVGFAPLMLLVIVWGLVMVRSYSKYASSYTVEGIPKLPWTIMSSMVMKPNFGGYYTYYAVVALVAIIFVVTVVRLIRRADDETLYSLWFLIAAFAPALLAFALFLLSGHERYSYRYFSFSVGPLAVLVVIGFYQAMMLLSRAVPSVRRIALIGTAIVGVVLASPGGLYGLQKTKADWRGIAKAIVERINQEPGKSFTVYETTFRKYPTLDYYLSRVSDDVRVHDTLRRYFERRSVEFSPPNTDYAIVAFTHQKIRNYPKTLEVLKNKMQLREEHINSEGRGYLVFEVRG